MRQENEQTGLERRELTSPRQLLAVAGSTGVKPTFGTASRFATEWRRRPKALPLLHRASPMRPGGFWSSDRQIEGRDIIEQKIELPTVTRPAANERIRSSRKRQHRAQSCTHPVRPRFKRKRHQLLIRHANAAKGRDINSDRTDLHRTRTYAGTRRIGSKAEPQRARSGRRCVSNTSLAIGISSSGGQERPGWRARQIDITRYVADSRTAGRRQKYRPVTRRYRRALRRPLQSIRSCNANERTHAHRYRHRRQRPHYAIHRSPQVPSLALHFTIIQSLGRQYLMRRQAIEQSWSVKPRAAFARHFRGVQSHTRHRIEIRR